MKGSIQFVFFVFILILGSCTTPRAKKKSKTDKGELKVSTIELAQHGQSRSFSVVYNSDGSINFDMASSRQQNVSIRNEYNSNGMLIEMISGADRINYLYGPGAQRMEIFFQKQNQRCLFSYDQDGRVSTQWTITNDDTTSTYQYEYEGDSQMPVRVQMSAISGTSRSYRLHYSTIKNKFTNLFESVFPVDAVYWLGWAAMYGDNYLESADMESTADSNEPPSYLNAIGKTFRFTIDSKESKETVSLANDGSRNWSATTGMKKQ